MNRLAILGLIFTGILLFLTLSSQGQNTISVPLQGGGRLEMPAEDHWGPGTASSPDVGTAPSSPVSEHTPLTRTTRPIESAPKVEFIPISPLRVIVIRGHHEEEDEEEDHNEDEEENDD